MFALISQVYPAAIREESRKQLAMEFSGGRTDRTSKLTEDELKRLICSLESAVKQTRKPEEELTSAQRKFFALRKSLGWSYERLSDFIIEQTAGAKTHSRQLDNKELNTLISVMEKIEVNKYKQRNKQA